MRQSNLFTRAIKENPKDESSYNAQALIRAGFIDKLGAGIYTFLPLGLNVLNKITTIIREEMNLAGAQEILMPTLHPKESWQKTNRWEDLDVLFKLKASDNRDYALGPTHEEIITPLIQKFALSYKDFPLAAYQIQTKFRNEKRAKAGLLRGREFLMKDLYSFHTNEEDLETYYEKMMQVYEKIYQRLGLGDLTYLTYSSGGTFSKYSHEFQTLCSDGEDFIYLCEKCRLAVNKEIIAEHNFCPQCQNKDLKEKKAIEVGNIFKLKNKYSQAFSFNFKDQNEESKEVLMGCYGLGISRVMGAIVEVCHDERGIVWPSNLAPFSVHLLSFKQNEASEKIYQQLLAEKIEVLYDDRLDFSPGEKLAEADLIGCPNRLILSEKTLEQGKIEFKLRNGQESQLINPQELLNFIKKD